MNHSQPMRRSALAAIAIATLCTAAQAGETCNAATTRGNWVYTCEGTLQASARLLGRCSASRTGYWSCIGMANFGGDVQPQTLDGQAQTNADCTGTISYTSTVAGAPAGVLDIYYVISNGGTVISGLPTNTGGVLACSLRRIGGRDD